jgi:hypothetical protein
MKIKQYLNLFLVIISISCISCVAQVEETEEPRTIEVTGSAEMAVQPDEVELSIVLRTSSAKDKKKEFLKILAEQGITEDKIVFESSNNYNWWWYYSNYYDNSVQRYTVSIDSTVDAMALMDKLKQPWIEQIRVSNRSNSKIEVYRKEVKIQAIKSAKEKAEYMLAALGEELGGVVAITEVNGDHNTTSPYYYWK